MGIEGMDGLLLLFTAIASCDWAIWVRFPTSATSKTNVSPLYLGTPEFSAPQYYEVEGREKSSNPYGDISRPR